MFVGVHRLVIPSCPVGAICNCCRQLLLATQSAEITFQLVLPNSSIRAAGEVKLIAYWRGSHIYQFVFVFLIKRLFSIFCCRLFLENPREMVLNLPLPSPLCSPFSTQPQRKTSHSN